MSYESLKIVLQHMDANKRFEIATRCPSLRQTEKIVPLKINKLQVYPLGVIVNDIKYNISTYRKYPEGMVVSDYHDECNKNPNYDAEIDQYGAKLKFQSIDLTPGDIFVKEPIYSGDDITDEKDIEDLVSETTRVEEDLRQHTGDQPLYSHYYRTAEQATRWLERCRDDLRSFLNRRDNVLPPYQVTIKLEMTNLKNGSSKIELYKKNKKIPEAIKYLTTLMFGGRHTSILGGNLEFDDYLTILRLPVGLKIKVRELSAESSILAVIAPIIDEASIPLQAIRVHGSEISVEDLSHPWEKSARKIIFQTNRGNYPSREAIPEFSNDEICLVGDYLNPKEYDSIFEIVVKQWTLMNRAVGSCVSIEKIGVIPREVMENLEDLCDPFNGVRINKWRFNIPLTIISQFKVVFEFEGKPESDEDVEWNADDDVVWMHEVENEQAVNGFIKIIVVPV